MFPTLKCKLRSMKLDRIKDFLLLEKEFIENKEALKPKKEADKVRTHIACQVDSQYGYLE